MHIAKHVRVAEVAKALVGALGTMTLLAWLPYGAPPRALPLQATISRNVLNVRYFGARGDGHTDDTAAIAAALEAARKSGGGTVYVPAGVYLIDPPAQPLYLSSNVTLLGVGNASVLRVKDDAGQYNFIFVQHPGTLSNVALRRLRFDQNPAGNRTSNINALTDAENVVQVYDFDNLVIDKVSFDPEPGVQAVVAAGPRAPRRLSITNSLFRFVRGKSDDRYYDNSSVYSEAAGVLILGNRFMTTNRQNAITAIEVHGGPGIDIAHNTVVHFQNGMNLTNSTRGYRHVARAQIHVHDNLLQGTAFGFDLWSIGGEVLRDVTIEDNTVTFAQHRLYRDTWLGILCQPGGRGQGLGGDFRDIVVRRNVFDFSPLRRQRVRTLLAMGMQWSPNGNVANVTLEDNTILESPGAGIV
ncbi:MAG: hypothetical protein JO043_05530, partial [Candidatus Eremiobacteraeota bacterium]|nr:hypothetical protein [Candidatus Eremiobacteraeota bacterium]